MKFIFFILEILINPLNWIVAMFILAMLFRKASRKKFLLKTGIISLLFFSNPFIINLVMKAWEVNPYPISEIKNKYDVGILLGGYTGSNSSSSEYMSFNQNFRRLTSSMELYRLEKIDRLMISGGKHRFQSEGLPEALRISNFLLTAGIDTADIILEEQSNTTNENARNAFKVLKMNFTEPSVLLITSAFHMRRAGACFKKRNIPYTPFPTGSRVTRFTFSLKNTILPDHRSFDKWRLVIREMLGFVYYWMRGFI